MTYQEARERVRGVGMVLRKVDGEYRVNFPQGAEESAYYTDCLSDAVSTAAHMAKIR